MAKYRLQIITNEKGQKKTKTVKYSTTDNETVQVYSQVDKGEKKFLGEVTYGPDSAPPPPPEPEPDLAPIIDAGEDATVAEGAEVTIDGSGKDDGKIVSVEWKYDTEIEQYVTKNPDDPYELKFKAPELLDTETARGFFFKLVVEDDKSNRSTDTCLITVTQRGEQPPLPPTPPETGTLIYCSNRDGKWNNGVKRVVTESEGNVGPDGKGLYTAASGDPELHIDGDGVAHLVSGSGGVDNLSVKGLSMHQNGGDCGNRGGGEGIGLKRNGWDIKREVCHNIHDSIDDGSIQKPIEDYKWHELIFKWVHENKQIHLQAFLDYKDGKGPVKIADCVDSNPDAWFMDKILVGKNSYVWIRLNNADHGRIYIMVINWDAEMHVPFMFEPKENSIALKDVQVIAL